MRITLLGTGTSTGIPIIGCLCATCASTDLRDKRLRVSALIEVGATKILIDAGPDFRQQMLTAKVTHLDAILYTHHHADHIMGFDDIRAFNVKGKTPPKCYALKETLDIIKTTFPYAFAEPTGSGFVPKVEFEIIDSSPFLINDVLIQPIPIRHGNLEILGYRIGNFAYLTDCSHISISSKENLKALEILVLDGLRYKPHPTHFSIDESCAIAKELAPKMTYLIHMNHDVLHEEAEKKLPKGVWLGYDNMELVL